MYDGRTILYAKEREDAVSRELAMCGYFVIVISEKMTAAEALRIYKGRDSTEKLFRADKWFVALIIRNRIHFYLKNAKKKNFMNVLAANLKELMDRRDEIRTREISDAIRSSRHTYDEILNFIRA